MTAVTGTYKFVLQCVAVCCSALQCVAVRCNFLTIVDANHLSVDVYCTVSHCVAQCCVLQCVAECSSLLQYIAKAGVIYICIYI